MQVKVISGSIDPLWEIANAARVCTRTQDKNKAESREAFVRARIRNGEENLLEHAYVQLDIRGISRACLQQLVRHRFHVVYSVESQRYVSQENAEFIIPPSIKGTEMESSYRAACSVMMNNYESLIEKGVPKEDARYLLPESVGTHLVITYNFRGLRHLIRMRGVKKAQWEIRELAQKVKEAVAEKYGTDFFIEGLEGLCSM